MIRTSVLFSVLLALGSSAFAQTTATSQRTEVLQSCLLGTNTNTWNFLKLSRDQMERTRMIQEACKEECAAAGVKPRNDGISTADGSTIISELKNVLTSDQFDQWVAYCAGQTTGDVVK